VNYDDSFVVTVTVTCYIWAPSTGDHSLHVAHLQAATLGLYYFRSD